MSLKLGVLCSGRGTDLQSIIDAISAKKLDAEIAIVLTDRPNVPALIRAEKAKIENVCVDRKQFTDQKAFEGKLLDHLFRVGVDLVVLAGFMRLLSSKFIRAYPNKIMNIHPALLPNFPGTHAQRDALEYGVKISGCTIHFIDEGMDTGPIILQSAVPVLEDDTEETLSKRILEEEHKLYPRAIQLYAEGRLKIEGRRVRILEESK